MASSCFDPTMSTRMHISPTMFEGGQPPPPLAIALSAIVSLVIVIPLRGVLVRFRANYNPKGVQLDSEGGEATHTGPVVNSYIKMFLRTYKLEGVSGLYKGIMPTVLSTALISLIVLAVDTVAPHLAKYRVPDANVLGTLLYSFVMLIISLPTTILTYRSMTTPHKLPYFNAAKGLQVLLTRTERRRPWILYFTPGLVVAQLCHIVVVVVLLGPINHILLPRGSGGVIEASDFSIWKLVLYLILMVASILIVAPLEVITIRLAIQRNHASAEYNSLSQEVDGEPSNTEEYSGGEEDVIRLRSESDPYIGLVDSTKRIITEEGYLTLYRAWWVVFLAIFGGSVAIWARSFT